MLIDQRYTLRKDTKLYTISDVEKEIQECCEILASIGYRDALENSYTVSFNNRALKRYGQCTKENYHFYHIEINEKYLRCAPPEDVHNTICHEVIHSVEGCMNHGKKWQTIANSVNLSYKFTNIERTGNCKEYKEAVLKNEYKYIVTCDKCGKSWGYMRKCKIYDSCLKGKATHNSCGGKKFTCKYIGK